MGQAIKEITIIWRCANCNNKYSSEYEAQECKCDRLVDNQKIKIGKL